MEQIPAALGRDKAVAPQAIPQSGPDGPTVDIGNLSNPVDLEQRLRRLMKGGASPFQLTVPHGQARLGDFSVAAAETLTGNLLVLEGQADLFGRVVGNVVALDGNIVMHPGASVTGDALAIGGRILDRGGVVQGEQRSLGAAPVVAAKSGGALSTALTNAAGLAGVLLTLGLLGFGVVLLARPNLETISDTVSHSFFRSFLTGLLAQILVVPTFGMVITGLVLSVVGILLVPFVVVVIPVPSPGRGRRRIPGGGAHHGRDPPPPAHGGGRDGRIGQQLPVSDAGADRESARCGSRGSCSGGFRWRAR